MLFAYPPLYYNSIELRWHMVDAGEYNCNCGMLRVPME